MCFCYMHITYTYTSVQVVVIFIGFNKSYFTIFRSILLKRFANLTTHIYGVNDRINQVMCLQHQALVVVIYDQNVVQCLLVDAL